MAMLPIRSRILEYLSTVEGADVSQVQCALEPEYGQERQFSRKGLDNHLMNLKENELVEETGYDLRDGNLEIEYAITMEGKNMVKRYLHRFDRAGRPSA